ncbi:MAG TPA: PucR family transcriptional regulator ligand-binding domain-containing protein [Micromonosporaceae bacterium]
METVADAEGVSSARGANAGTPVGLRVREVLAAPCLAQARVLAGSAGLDRIVSRLNVMEVPDILPWVKPHELLMTTGYPVREDPAALVRLVTELDDRGLAALAIKLHRYLDELPTELLAEADRRGFPIIEFPQSVGFDEVLNEVIGTLLNRQAALAARSEEVHRALVSVVLEGGDLGDLATELAAILGGPVLVTTPDGRVVAQAGDPAELARIQRSSAFDRFGRFRVEGEPEGVREESAGTFLPAGGPATDGLPTGDGLARPAGAVADMLDRGGAAAEVYRIPAPGRLFRAVVPIVAGRVDHGRIVTFSRVPISDADVHSLERAATVAALAVTKRLAVAAVEDKYRADFLRDLLTGRVDEVPAAVAHARSLGWHIDRPMVVAVAELDPGQASASVSGLELRPVHERFATAWQTVIRQRDPGAAVANFNAEVVVLLGAVPEAEMDRLVADLDRQVAGDRGGGRLSFALGVSRVAAGASDLANAYEQARTAVRIGRRLHGPGARATFDQLGAYRLLALIPDSAELRGYVTDVLGELNADSAEAADLRQTLEVLLDTNCNVAETARRLHFHYNTLRYRIDKLERLVGPLTTSAALRLDLSLALRVRQMRGA